MNLCTNFPVDLVSYSITQRVEKGSDRLSHRPYLKWPSGRQHLVYFACSRRLFTDHNGHLLQCIQLLGDNFIF